MGFAPTSTTHIDSSSVQNSKCYETLQAGHIIRQMREV